MYVTSYQMPVTVSLKVSKDIVKIKSYLISLKCMLYSQKWKDLWDFLLTIKPGQGNNNNVIRMVVPHLTPCIQKQVSLPKHWKQALRLYF